MLSGDKAAFRLNVAWMRAADPFLLGDFDVICICADGMNAVRLTTRCLNLPMAGAVVTCKPLIGRLNPWNCVLDLCIFFFVCRIGPYLDLGTDPLRISCSL